MLRFIKALALTIGLFLMFAFTWPVDLSVAAFSRGLINFKVLELLAILVGYGIVIATILITAVVSGRIGIMALLRRFLIWRLSWRWYAVAFFLAPVLMLLTIALNSLLNQTQPDFNQYAAREIFGSGINPLLMYLPFFLFDFLANGGEIGWRGFALPRLQMRYSALAASLILGAVWAFWHLPKYFMAGSTLGGGREWNAAWLFLPMQNVGIAGLIIYWLAAILVVILTDSTRFLHRQKALPVTDPTPG